jgi:ABC-type nitrate/sulfonate/bicarbonate transport system ATPase subunit/ABC-type nitrate/sulfonate/bicarbonate transport system permease component
VSGASRPAALPKSLWYILGILALLALWSVGSLGAGAFIIPPPWTTLADTLRLLGDGYSWMQILHTVLRVCVGFLLALTGGALVGIPGGRRGWLQDLFHPLVLFLQGMPPLLWAIPLILILGVGRLAPVLVIALICFPLIAVTLAEGMKSLPRSLEQMLRLFAPGSRALLRELVLPHLRPFIASSLKLGLVLGIKASVTAEYFGANNGIGFQLQAAYQSMQVRRLFSWALLLLLLILAFNWLLGWMERLVKAADLATRRARPARAGSAEGLEMLKRSFLTQSGRAVIRLSQVGFAYPGGSPVLQGLELEVEPERIAVISGDSGIGKTTLLYLIASLLEPSTGSIERPPSIGLVFQDDRLLPWRSNAWNAALPLIYGGLPPAEALSFAGYLLEEAGLGGREWEYPEALSGGMKKRLAFARCFARFPEAILLDEPFTGLDAEARRQLWQKFFDLLALHRGPVVVVTHFPEEIPYAERCVFYSLEPAAEGDGRGAPADAGLAGDKAPADAARAGNKAPAALKRVRRPGSPSAGQA